jgi:hypothetical protein
VFLGFGYTWLMRTGRVTWIISVIQVFKFIGFVFVIRQIGLLLREMNNEHAKKRKAPSERQGRWNVRNLNAHFAGMDCAYICHLWR